MSKMRILGSQFSDTDLKVDVCSHLTPILGLLEARGNSYDRSKALYRDKYSEYQKEVSKPIDFDLIEESFEIPNFIVLDRRRKSVLCQTCWCAIVEKTSEPVAINYSKPRHGQT